jgi:hypothetical protein
MTLFVVSFSFPNLEIRTTKKRNRISMCAIYNPFLSANPNEPLTARILSTTLDTGSQNCVERTQLVASVV